MAYAVARTEVQPKASSSGGQDILSNPPVSRMPARKQSSEVQPKAKSMIQSNGGRQDLPSTSPSHFRPARVEVCLVVARTTIRQLLHKDVLQEFHGVRNHGVIQSKSWDKLLVIESIYNYI